MENIKPTVGYLAAWSAVNKANKPRMGYSSLTAMKQKRFARERDGIEAAYFVRRRGPLTQLMHSFMWAVSPGYRDKKLENRHALLNMIEDQIRTSSGSDAKYAYNGKELPQRSPQSENNPQVMVRPSKAHSDVWKNGAPPVDLPEKIGAALQRAERNIENRQAFLDSLHRVFLTAAAHLDRNPEPEEAEPTQSIAPEQQDGIQDMMARKANNSDTQEVLQHAIKTEYLKSRQTRWGRVQPDGFKDVASRGTAENPQPGDAFGGTVIQPSNQLQPNVSDGTQAQTTGGESLYSRATPKSLRTGTAPPPPRDTAGREEPEIQVTVNTDTAPSEPSRPRPLPPTPTSEAPQKPPRRQQPMNNVGFASPRENAAGGTVIQVPDQLQQNAPDGAETTKNDPGPPVVSMDQQPRHPAPEPPTMNRGQKPEIQVTVNTDTAPSEPSRPRPLPPTPTSEAPQKPPRRENAVGGTVIQVPDQLQQNAPDGAETTKNDPGPPVVSMDQQPRHPDPEPPTMNRGQEPEIQVIQDTPAQPTPPKINKAGPSTKTQEAPKSESVV